MKRVIPQAIVFFLAVLGPGPEAAAQTKNVFPSGMTVELDGDAVPNANVAYINVANCSKPSKLKFRLTTALLQTANIPVVETWVGSGADTDCSNPTNRQDRSTGSTGSDGDGGVSSGGITTCWRIDSSKGGVNGTYSVEYDVNKVFNRESDKCPDSTGTAFNVYFVPLSQATSSASAPPAIPLNGPIRATFTLYSARPVAPKSLSAKSGENSLGVSWKSGTTTTGTQYRVYYDVSGGGGDTGDGGAACGSGLLKAGDDPPGDGAVKSGQVVRGSKTSSRSDSLGGLDGQGVELGESVAAAAVTVDIAGNESKLSEVVCIKRVKTDGYLDLTGGKGLDECTIHARGPSSLGGLACLTTLGLALAVRRRRTAS